MQDLMNLLNMIGGRNTPPAMGGPTPPQGTPYPIGAMGANNTAMAALAGIGMMQALDTMRKYEKTKNSVGMSLDKPQEVSPMASGIGPADLQARAQRMGAQQSPQGPPGGPPSGMPGMPPMMGGGGGGGPVMPPGGMPPGMLMALLAQRGQGGGM